ncbi:19373_t:CDS:2, partial [Cetraspora pellucida]
TTSNLKKHLKLHKGRVPELNEPGVKEGATVLDMLNRNCHREPFNQQKFTNLIKSWVIKRNRSFQIVEDDELRSIFTYLEPRAVVPSADLVKRQITTNFEKERKGLQQKLQEIPGCIAITTDIWTTSNNEKSFMAVTIHYLNVSWKIKHILLDFIFMEGSHTGAAIASAMENCLQKNRIISKLMAITCDNASSNIKFLNDFSNSLSLAGFYFDSTQQSIRCFGHVLNLTVQSILNVVGDELGK